MKVMHMTNSNTDSLWLSAENIPGLKIQSWSLLLLPSKNVLKTDSKLGRQHQSLKLLKSGVPCVKLASLYTCHQLYKRIRQRQEDKFLQIFC